MRHPLSSAVFKATVALAFISRSRLAYNLYLPCTAKTLGHIANGIRNLKYGAIV